MAMATRDLTRPSNAPVTARGGAEPGRRCPGCGYEGILFRSAKAIAADLWVARRWWDAQAAERGVASQPPVHGEPSDVARCCSCGTLWRTRPGLWQGVVERYRSDPYDHDALASLHRWEAASCRREGAWYARQGLGPGHRALEVGCYVGGFLRLATELGARVRGVDVGVDAVRFCRSLGYAVDEGDVTSVDPGERFDSVWVLNCFDQLPDPLGSLKHIRTLLAPGGRVVIHTPDARAIRRAYLLGGDQVRAALDDQLWGVPFLACYSREALTDLCRRAGLQPVAAPARPTGGWQDAVALRPA